jgi:rhamnosyltransferase
MIKKKDFCILLAAYNGEKYLKKQILSILIQKNVSLDIFISLDKSNDNSLKIIKEIQKKNSNVYLVSKSKVFGSASFNFINLIKKINFKNYKYISFSDQDDIWLKKKLYVAKKIIIKLGLDGYASNTLSFNSRHKKLIIKDQNFTEFDFLFEGGGPGHSMVITKKIALSIQNKLKCLVNKVDLINYYDWFIYYYVRAKNGKWFIDFNYFTLYRQHRFNEIGSNLGFQGIIKRCKVVFNDNIFEESKNYAIFTNIYKKKKIKLIYGKSFRSFFYVILNFYKFRRKKNDKFFFLIVYILLFLINLNSKFFEIFRISRIFKLI